MMHQSCYLFMLAALTFIFYFCFVSQRIKAKEKKVSQRMSRWMMAEYVFLLINDALTSISNTIHPSPCLALHRYQEALSLPNRLPSSTSKDGARRSSSSTFR